MFFFLLALLSSKFLFSKKHALPILFFVAIEANSTNVCFDLLPGVIFSCKRNHRK